MRRGQRKGQQLDPIARWETIDGEETLLMDTCALMLHLGISARTVRRYREHQVKTDEATGAPLYDAFAVGVERKNVQTRPISGRAA
jgi:hypothetical protein